MSDKGVSLPILSYEIRVTNHRGMYWTTYFYGWDINNLENGQVLLSNTNIDQSELLGILNRIRDLNLILLSVKTI